MDLKTRIARNVRQIRKRLGLTQQELADRIQMTNRYLSLLENTPQNISVDVLQSLAKALEVPVERLIDAEPRSQIADKDFVQEFDRIVKELKDLRKSLDQKK
ncbi:MAG: helix-turn-helix domain-containing protein [Oligoflexus sp.]